MLELRSVPLAVVRVFGAPPLPGAHRIAPDEQLLVGDSPAELVALAGDASLVVDHSDGVAAFELAGDDVDAAFARLSELQLPAGRPAFLQGLVADLPAKVIVTDTLLVLVSSVVCDSFRAGVLEACAGLAVREGSDERALA